MDVTQKAINRYWNKVKKGGECWIWTAGQTSDGYGACTIFIDEKWKTFKAHRLAYILTHGDLTRPELHHKCATKLCVRPNHLQPMDRKEHMNVTPETYGYKWAQRTHCEKGHLLEGENLLPSATKDGYRKCRTCSIEASRKWREANPEKMRAAVDRYRSAHHDELVEKNRWYNEHVRGRKPGKSHLLMR